MVRGISRFQRGAQGFPPLLESIVDPPAEIWVRGEVGETPGVAIVGTRKATSYGLDMAMTMGRAVAHAGWVVVSGLARGVDGAAHQGCVDGGGRGVAVLGSGLDIWYPPEHRRLGEELVASGGAVISEYPPGSRPEPWHFPARNRLIVALSSVVVVTEAAARGGALITARLAAEQGRDVFAVPGDVTRSTSIGTNLLIRDGAIPVLGADDLLEAISLVMGPAPGGTTGHPTELPLGLGVEPRTVGELVAANGGDTIGVLRSLGQLEAEGRIRMENGVVVPMS